MGLTESQEEALIAMADQAADKSQAIYHESLGVEERVKGLLAELEAAVD